MSSNSFGSYDARALVFSNSIDKFELPGVQIVTPYMRILQSSIKMGLYNLLTGGHSNLCEGLSLNFVLNSIQTCDILLFMQRTENPTSVLGFATLFLHGKNLHLDIICTNKNYKGIGRRIMDLIYTIKTNLNLDAVTLCSLQQVRGFYDKMGFIEDPTMNCGGIVGMQKRGGSRRNQRRRQKTRRSRRH
jgi:hypothetical protein